MCAVYDRTVVDSRVSQLTKELHTVHTQHKAEVERLNKQLREERAKAEHVATKVGIRFMVLCTFIKICMCP